MSDSTTTTLNSSLAVANPTPWVPNRPVASLTDQGVQSELCAVKAGLSSLSLISAQQAPTSSSSSNPPGVCQNLEAEESPYKTTNGMVSLVSVSFDNADTHFATADIYFTGYHGSTATQFVASGTESPISFLCETTKETITVTVVAVDANGSFLSIDQAPTTTVSLDGVVSPPPPPSIASGLVLTALGYTFSFNAEGGLLHDLIDGYRIYRNTTNTFTGATQIQYIAQPPIDDGAIQVQDVMPANTAVNYWYWVSAVNTSGLESTPEPVGDAVSGGIPQQVYDISATESPYKTTSNQMLSLVAVDYTAVDDDPYFEGVQIYFTGYHGNTDPQMMAEGSVSPIQFLCETTGETVTVTVVAVSPSGTSADYASAPTVVLALDGQVSAPPAPSIAQAQVSLGVGGGWQFAFNIIGGLEFDLIDGYRIYHGSAADGTDKEYFTYYKQPSTNSGTITVQENTSDILHYWVSAVSTAGLESVLTEAPFVYTDPNDPAPTAQPPVTTTNLYGPTVLLNGWGASAHVGFWETQNSDNGTNFGYSSSQICLPFSTPENAYDGNQTTAASFTDRNHADYAACVWSFGAELTGVTVTSATLAVTSEVPAIGRPIHGEASIYYSTDNGVNWTQVYLASYQIGNAYRAKQTDTITLPTTIDPTQLQVMACAHSHDDITMYVYDISLTVVQSAPSGPQPVPGVVASLDPSTHEIHLVWNGLTPTDRTDVIGYEVTRGLRGSAYAHSYVVATIPFVSGQSSYSWDDAEVHNGSYVYWVVANNSTGWSAPSSPAGITGASSSVYSNGETVESMMPAEPGADVTGDNTANDTNNVNGVPAGTVTAGATIAAQTASVDYLTNADKIALIADYTAELATQSTLDAQATSLGVSHTAYDAAVAGINTVLISAGAPSNWATTWPDGMTSGPSTNITGSLASAWATIASARTALQTAISNQQAAAAQVAAIFRCRSRCSN